jgi:hypothetical protein
MQLLYQFQPMEFSVRLLLSAHYSLVTIEEEDDDVDDVVAIDVVNFLVKQWAPSLSDVVEHSRSQEININ